MNKKIHLIGIGGISMSGIAEMLLKDNYIVSGSDINESTIIENLIKDGAIIKIGHHPELIKEAEIVVYTAAIKNDDPELKEAQRLHKKCYERAEFLGLLMPKYKNRLCISGTHGKSTTTGMVSSIFLDASLKPTISIGAILPKINANYLIGEKDYFIMEACEYVDSFLNFLPTSEVILNIDDDHLDYFKNIDNIKASFLKYINLLPDDGFAVVNLDEENIREIISKTSKKIISYGINEDADFTAKNLSVNEYGCYSFDIYHSNKCLTNINLKITGKHNIYNALAAFTLATQYNMEISVIKEALENYTGVNRRFEYIGTYNGAKIYDDYAHHPTEIASTVESVKGIKHKESWAVFQSHTYSRTLDHMNEFAEILSNFDHIIIAKIYPAREENIYNVREEDLVNKIKKINPNVIYLDSFSKIKDYLKENITSEDIVITIGAGPINEVAYSLKKE